MKVENHKIHYYVGDIEDGIEINGSIAIDTEASGLKIYTRDKLCLVQIATESKDVILVHFPDFDYSNAKNLNKLLNNNKIQKIFHFARFDIGALNHHLGVDVQNVYCTKIASKLSRTYTDKHSLRELVREVFGKELNKQEQCSDWAARDLTRDQMTYAMGDVIYLHKIKESLDTKLFRMGRTKLAEACFAFLPHRVELDRNGFEESDIFSHM
ncbi:MAG: ribonuclease D [Alphaproteobacteria bacterium]